MPISESGFWSFRGVIALDSLYFLSSRATWLSLLELGVQLCNNPAELLRSPRQRFDSEEGVLITIYLFLRGHVRNVHGITDTPLFLFIPTSFFLRSWMFSTAISTKKNINAIGGKNLHLMQIIWRLRSLYYKNTISKCTSNLCWQL